MSIHVFDIYGLNIIINNITYSSRAWLIVGEHTQSLYLECLLLVMLNPIIEVTHRVHCNLYKNVFLIEP